MEGLTKRQSDVLRLAAAGMTNDEIAQGLGIGSESVKTHLSAAYKKLGVRNRMEAVNKIKGRLRKEIANAATVIAENSGGE